MQEIRRFKPSTVSRRFSVVAGFYRTCVIDGIMEHSPAEHVRRPAVPAESPTLGSSVRVRTQDQDGDALGLDLVPQNTLMPK
jgi:site-specific recombinase XerD